MPRLALRLPGSVPAAVLGGPLVTWTRRYVVRVAARHPVVLADLWDEAVAALVRTTVYGELVHGTIGTRYGQTAVRRACWRYVVRSSMTHAPLASLEHLTQRLEDEALPCPLFLSSPSPETLLIARETASTNGHTACAKPLALVAGESPQNVRHAAHRHREREAADGVGKGGR